MGTTNKLNDKRIRALSFDGKLRKYSDGGGLHLLVNHVGKYWKYGYRFGGKQKTLSLGVYPTVTLKAARDAHQAAAAELRLGADPSLKKRSTKEAFESDTFRSLAESWFTRMSSEWSPKNIRTQRQRLDSYLLPEFGDTPAKTITTRDVLTLLRKIESKGTINTAHKIQQIINQILQYGVHQAIIEQNVATATRGALLPKPTAKPLAHITHPDRFGELLRSIDHYSGSPEVAFALQLLPHWFLRSNELRNLTWDEVDFENRLITISPERMKGRKRTASTRPPHLLPISNQTTLLLEKLYPHTGTHSLLFPSSSKPTQPISDQALSNGLKRLGWSGKDQTVHGFRHSFSTMMNEYAKQHIGMGVDTELIEVQLAHQGKDAIRQIYNHANYLKPRRNLMQLWSDQIDEMKNRKELSNVRSR